MAATLATLIGWLLFVALVLALGGVAARLLVLPRAARAEPGPAAGLALAAARVSLAGAALAPLAIGLVFVRQLLEFRDPFVPWQEDARLLLLGTAWGGVWLAAAAASLVCAAGFVLAARGRRGGWWLGAPAALALAAFPALTGHASGTGTLRWITVPADVLHVWAAGCWVGGLAFVLYADAWVRRAVPGGSQPIRDAPAHPDPEPPRPSQAGALALLVPAFSPVAVACVATLVLTGALASWVHLPAPGAFLSSPYGRTLGAKLLLALVVLGLGATNWRRLTPRLQEPGGGRALRRSALVELGVAQLVLLVTALLVRTAP